MIKDLDLESLSRILRAALNPVVVSLEKRSQETQHAEMKPRDEETDRKDVATSPGQLEPPEAGRAGRALPWGLPRERGAAHSWILDFWPPDSE